jgi:hypothetical protein
MRRSSSRAAAEKALLPNLAEDTGKKVSNPEAV